MYKHSHTRISPKYPKPGWKWSYQTARPYGQAALGHAIASGYDEIAEYLSVTGAAK